MIIINKNERKFIDNLLETLYQLQIIKCRTEFLCSELLDNDIDNSICDIKFIIFDFIHNNIIDKEYCKEVARHWFNEWCSEEDNEITLKNNAVLDDALAMFDELIDDDYDYQNNRSENFLNMYGTTKDKEVD